MPNIDINCDLGEGNKLQDCDYDQQLMAYIHRCNIACGAHAGSAEIMQLSMQNASKHHLKIGAHPGYADKQNFGRRSLDISWSQLQDMLLEQLELFFHCAKKSDATVTHIKLHGALYNDAEQSPALATQIVQLLQQHYPQQQILGLAGGCVQQACQTLQHSFLREGFMDRRYLDSGQLTPRSQPGAVIQQQALVVEQAQQLLKRQPISTNSGHRLHLEVDSICLHGDTPGALELAKSLKQILQAGCE